MLDRSDRYWPFSPEAMERGAVTNEDEIRFLDAAYSEGFRPYVFGGNNFGATNESRTAVILCRGRRGRELTLGAEGAYPVDLYVDEFGVAALASLQWLRGASVDDVAEIVDGHVNIPSWSIKKPLR